jgi:hypothetical protein
MVYSYISELVLGQIPFLRVTLTVRFRSSPADVVELVDTHA